MFSKDAIAQRAFLLEFSSTTTEAISLEDEVQPSPWSDAITFIVVLVVIIVLVVILMTLIILRLERSKSDLKSLLLRSRRRRNLEAAAGRA